MTMPTFDILVFDETGLHQTETSLLKEKIALAEIPLCSSPSQAGPCTYALAFTTDKLELRPPDIRLGAPFSVDFGSGSIRYRMAQGGGKSQDIARAVGLKKGAPHIIDATCGFAKDGFILASLGCTIALCERSPITHALVADALKRAGNDPLLSNIVSRITLHLGDSLDLVPQLSAIQPAEVIYLDPMYPHRTKSALVKKQMRMLRHIVGKDPDANLLHSLALQYAKKRVVCKRPITADFLNDKKPDFTVKGKKHRFDVYLSPPIKS
jgi:16S rRNA (guanine1516-N2)-methyltransferase